MTFCLTALNITWSNVDMISVALHSIHLSEIPCEMANVSFSKQNQFKKYTYKVTMKSPIDQWIN